MRKVTIKFKNLFCDFCTYDIEMVLEEFSEVGKYKIYRHSNTLEVFLKEYESSLIERIKESFNREGLEVVEVIGG